jgi:hypothetical protein
MQEYEEKIRQEGFEPKVKFEQIFESQDPAERKTKIICTLG